MRDLYFYHHHYHHHVVLVARISLTLSRHFPCRSSPQAVLLDNIPYPHIVAECMFVLVVLLLHGHVWGSIRVHHFIKKYIRTLFKSSLSVDYVPVYIFIRVVYYTTYVPHVFVYVYMQLYVTLQQKCICHATILLILTPFRWDFFYSKNNWNFVEPQKETNSRNT